MIGITGFEDHRISCIIGVHPEELINEQEILLDVYFEQDFSRISQTDDLMSAVCYTAVANYCTHLAKDGKHKMLETLIKELALKLTHHFNLNWVKIKIKKPKAILTASYAFVEIEYGTKRRSF